MAGNHLEAILKCGCCGGKECQFCCLPMRYDVSHPFGVLADIPFQIIGCGDGGGTFVTIPGDEPCQTEQVYDTTFVPSLSSRIYSQTGSTCSVTPCSTPIILKLECSALFAEPGDDAQCDRLRLWIGTILKQIGDTGEVPGGATTAVSWTWVRPVECFCVRDEGVSAVFPINVVIDPSGLPVGTVGECAGLPLNLCTVACSAILVI